MLANSGIVEIVYLRPYRKDMEKVEAMMASKGIVFRQLENYEPPKETMISVAE
jgi:dCMP deaminase